MKKKLCYFDLHSPSDNETTSSPIMLSSHFDPKTVLWRYISTEQFLSMLSTKSLYFARLDTLEDPFEGYPFHLDNKYRYMDYSQLERNWIFVNCWHENEDESEHMWKHHGIENSIAIKTSIDNFINSINNDTATKPGVTIARVDYINPQEEVDITTDKIKRRIFSPYFYKRKQFEYEQEVRVVCPLDLASEGLSVKEYYEVLKQHPKGFYFPVCLNSLIEEIVVAPTSGRWYHDLISDTLHQYKLNSDMLRESVIQTSPLWNHDSFADFIFSDIDESMKDKPFYRIDAAPGTRKFTISPSSKIELVRQT